MATIKIIKSSGQSNPSAGFTRISIALQPHLWRRFRLVLINYGKVILTLIFFTSLQLAQLFQLSELRVNNSYLSLATLSCNIEMNIYSFF